MSSEPQTIPGKPITMSEGRASKGGVNREAPTTKRPPAPKGQAVDVLTLEDKIGAKFSDELYFTDREGMIVIDGTLSPEGLKEFAEIVMEHFAEPQVTFHIKPNPTDTTDGELDPDDIKATLFGLAVVFGLIIFAGAVVHFTTGIAP